MTKFLSCKRTWQLLLVSCLSFQANAFPVQRHMRTGSTKPTVMALNYYTTTERAIPCTIFPRSHQLLALTNENFDIDADRNRGILVLMTVPLAWGTFEPVVRYVYAIEPPIPGLVFSPCYYLVAASALSILAWITSAKEPDNPSLNEHRDVSSGKAEAKYSDNSLPILGGMELGFYLFLGNALQVLGLKTLNSDRVAFLIQLTTVSACLDYE